MDWEGFSREKGRCKGNTFVESPRVGSLFKNVPCNFETARSGRYLGLDKNQQHLLKSNCRYKIILLRNKILRRGNRNS